MFRNTRLDTLSHRELQDLCRKVGLSAARSSQGCIDRLLDLQKSENELAKEAIKTPSSESDEEEEEEYASEEEEEEEEPKSAKRANKKNEEEDEDEEDEFTNELKLRKRILSGEEDEDEEDEEDEEESDEKESEESEEEDDEDEEEIDKIWVYVVYVTNLNADGDGESKAKSYHKTRKGANTACRQYVKDKIRRDSESDDDDSDDNQKRRRKKSRHQYGVYKKRDENGCLSMSVCEVIQAKVKRHYLED